MAGMSVAVVEVETPPFAMRELNNPEDVEPIERALAEAGPRVSFLDLLDPRYRLILCDVWGVVHDGVTLYPGTEERASAVAGRAVRRAHNKRAAHRRGRRPATRADWPFRDAYDFVATSGEAGIEALNALGEPVGFVGTSGDRIILEGRGVRIAKGEDFTDLACTGMMEGRPDPSAIEQT